MGTRNNTLAVGTDSSIGSLHLGLLDRSGFAAKGAGQQCKLVKIKSPATDQKLALLNLTRKVIMEHLGHHPIDRYRFAQAQKRVESAVEFLADSPDTLELLSSIPRYSSALYAQSVCVAFYASLIAQELGWNSAPTVTNIVIAGLLHEVGYKDIHPYLLNKSRDQMTLDEINIIESHPVRGAALISKLPRIPAEIAQIVSQHHEKDGSVGFPNRLSRREIHPLAEVIAVAAEFCEIAVQKQGLPAVSINQALQKLILSYGTLPDSEAFQALTTILIREFRQPSREVRLS